MPERGGHGSAPARAALVGNPSDGYGGAVIAVAIDRFRAHATAHATAQAAAHGSAQAARTPAIEPPNELVRAATARFARETSSAAPATIAWHTEIPRSVGLGGSSAIVIATIRALCELRAVELPPDRLALMAFRVETEDLGIAAGLQDRVAQAYGGVTFMEFGDRPRYEPLDPRLLPPLLIAWRAEAAEDSGPLHGRLRERHARGEHAVVAAMTELASLACDARRALHERDPARFGQCMNASFELRRGMLPLHPAHVELIEIARSGGAFANYAGSGGAVAVACEDERHRAAVAAAYEAAGCTTAPIPTAPPR